MGRYALLLMSDKEVSVAVSTFKEAENGRLGRFCLRSDEEIIETVPLRTKNAVPKILESFLGDCNELEQRVIQTRWEQKNTTDEISIVRYPISLAFYVNRAFEDYFKEGA